MARERLDCLLDRMFATQLSSPRFLEGCVGNLQQQSAQRDTGAEIQRLTSEINAFHRKRERVIDGFIEGVITPHERDKRLAVIDGGIRVAQDALIREDGNTSLDTKKLIDAFAPLVEWEHWTRDQKRQILFTLVPDIRVADYEVKSLGLNSSLFSNEDTRKGKDSWRRPA
jgi:hypothetical protein